MKFVGLMQDRLPLPQGQHLFARADIRLPPVDIHQFPKIVFFTVITKIFGKFHIGSVNKLGKTFTVPFDLFPLPPNIMSPFPEPLFTSCGFGFLSA